MSESKDSNRTKSGSSEGRTLSLKRSGGTGQVRQNFPRGRSKSVVVERKRKRTITPKGAPGEKEGTEATARAATKPAAQEKVSSTAKPQPEETARETEEPREQRGGSGVILRTLTNEEKEARAKALEGARATEEIERQRAESEAKRRAEEAEIREAERQAAAERQAEEEVRKLEEIEARRKAEEEAARRLEEEEARKKKGETLPTDKTEEPEDALAKSEAEAARLKKRKEEEEEQERRRAARKEEPKRRSGKLTIARALSSEEEERSRSLASMRRAREKVKRAHHQDELPAKVSREVVLPEVIQIQELANRMAERAIDVIKLLMKQGHMAKITDAIDADTAELIAQEMGHTVKRVSEADVEEGLAGEEDTPESLKPRAPVVTVMGHVDHGKTSLLDALRRADVVASEAGGITQHIGAYQVTMPSGDKITFLDTPGHEAFTAMRGRGARVTDIVVLVVAADDGVMPQTVEAINHARAAEVPIIVAINKIDKPDADPDRVRTDLLQYDLVPEEMGGDVQTVEVSALNKLNLDKLEEAILLQAEILELKANPDRSSADGAVIEAQIDKGRGPVATVLVRRGTLRVGDVFVAGAVWGRVRALINDRGESVVQAGPSEPVEILGLNAAPQAGDAFIVVENEARAREVSEYRSRKRHEMRAGTMARGSLEQMLGQLKEKDRKEAPLVIKADVQGSVEAIIGSFEKLSTDEVSARVIHSGVGGITESDVTLARATGAPIIGFNVRANKQAREAAERDGVEIRYYSVIYDLIDDVRAAMSGLLEPARRENFLGYAEIREVFNVSKVGRVAGCLITEGQVRRGAGVRLLRDDVVIHEGRLASLKRFKDEVKEVQSGQECGMAFENYQDIKAGDVIECFEVEEVERTL